MATFVIDLIVMIFGLPRVLFPFLIVDQFHRSPKAIGLLFAALAVGAPRGAHQWLDRKGSTARDSR